MVFCRERYNGYLLGIFGWEAICNLAEHFKRPEKDIIKGAVISAVVIGLLFLALSLVTIGTPRMAVKKATCLLSVL